MKSELAVAYLRRVAFLLVGLGLMAGLVGLHGFGWRGSAHLHTVMEALATQLAVAIGILALVRYYSRKDNTFLFIGSAFLGTAFLDGYHTAVTSEVFQPLMPSGLQSLIPWSWFASRLFLSVMLLLSWLVWYREQITNRAYQVDERAIYWFVAIFTLASFGFFAFSSVPDAYYREIFFHRPIDLIPAVLFAAAFAGYWQKGCWRNDKFEFWLLASIGVGFVSQAIFMSHSSSLFDYEFDMSHLLKILSYLCVCIGLLISVFATFRQSEEFGQRLGAFVDNTVDGIVTIDHQGIIETANPAVELMFGYRADELEGVNVALLVPENLRDEHQFFMDRSELDGARVFDHNRNLYGRRKDGSSFPIELTITGMRYDDVTKFAGIIRDITDRKRNEQLKNEFVSTVSHELRTPLTSIKGSLGLVKAGTVGELSEQAIGMVEIAYSNSERLVRLINDILDIKKIEAGKMSFQMKVQKLSALVASAMVDIAGYAEQLGVSLELSKVEWEDYVIGDADRLQQVFANLISNAAKFSPEGGKVDISVSRVGACLRVAVHDDGPGIPVKNRDSIFSKFSQVDGSDSRQTSGTGLGLNIAKSIVNSHRGGIFFECGAGAGTTFYVDLPVWEDGRDEPSSESDSEEEPEVLLYGS